MIEIKFEILKIKWGNAIANKFSKCKLYITTKWLLWLFAETKESSSLISRNVIGKPWKTLKKLHLTIISSISELHRLQLSLCEIPTLTPCQSYRPKIQFQKTAQNGHWLILTWHNPLSKNQKRWTQVWCATKHRMRLNLLELTSITVCIPTNRPQILNFHIIAQTNRENQITGDSGTLCEN